MRHVFCLEKGHYESCPRLTDEEIRDFIVFLSDNPQEGLRWTRDRAAQLERPREKGMNLQKIRERIELLESWLHKKLNTKSASPVSLPGSPLPVMATAESSPASFQRPSARVPLGPLPTSSMSNYTPRHEKSLPADKSNITADTAPTRTATHALFISLVPERFLKKQRQKITRERGLNSTGEEAMARLDRYDPECGKLALAEALVISGEYIGCKKCDRDASGGDSVMRESAARKRGYKCFNSRCRATVACKGLIDRARQDLDASDCQEILQHVYVYLESKNGVSSGLTIYGKNNSSAHTSTAAMSADTHPSSMRGTKRRAAEMSPERNKRTIVPGIATATLSDASLRMIRVHHDKRIRDKDYGSRFLPEAGRFKLAEAFLDKTMP